MTKIVASTMPGTAKMIWMPSLVQPGAEPALGAEQQHVDQAGDDRRDRERQVDQRDQEALAVELELGDRPGGGEAEDEVGRHRDRRDEQRQPDGGQRVGVGEGGEIGAKPVAERLDEDRRRSGRSRNDAEEGDGDARSAAAAHRWPLGGDAVAAGMAVERCGAWRRQTWPSLRRLQAWSRLMAKSSDEGDQQHDRGDRRRAGIVELLELDDDQERRDLRDDTGCCRR